MLSPAHLDYKLPSHQQGTSIMQPSQLALRGLFFIVLPLSACFQEDSPLDPAGESGDLRAFEIEKQDFTESESETGEPEPGCGNGVKEEDEWCDDGNNVSGDGCTAGCLDEWCGDFVANNNGEACDGGGMTPKCDSDCTLPECGDGLKNPFTGEEEECDDGNLEDNDGCSSTCKVEECGDGILQQGETCDNGKVNMDYSSPCDPNACNEDCSGPPPSCCGDGLLDGNEVCDEGLQNADYDSPCNTNCSGPAPYCGDYWLNGPEICDSVPGCQQDCNGFEPCNMPGLDCPSCAGCSMTVCEVEWVACLTDQACLDYLICLDTFSEAECKMQFPVLPLAYVPFQQCLEGPQCGAFCSVP